MSPNEQTMRATAAKILLHTHDNDLLAQCFLALVQLRDGNLCVWQLQPLIDQCAAALHSKLEDPPAEPAPKGGAMIEPGGENPYDNDEPKANP